MTLKLDPENPLATKVQTRDGRKARIICVDRRDANNQPILALVGDLTCRDRTFEDCFPYCLNGRWQVPWIDEPNPRDLINVPETKSYWANVYPDRLGALQIHKEDCAAMTQSRERTSILEIRMCDGKLVEAIQHEIDK